jgi:glucose-6-phosphate 1-dehydrogenase
MSALAHSASSALEGASPQEIEWLTSSGLSVVVVGASGDLAKKKTYPSLLNLFADRLLPENTLIWGYARSKLSDDELRDRVRPYLSNSNHSAEVVEKFLAVCRYIGGAS